MLLLACVLAGCGRIAFDAIAQDADSPDAPVDAGPPRPPAGRVLHLDGTGYMTADSVVPAVAGLPHGGRVDLARRPAAAAAGDGNFFASFNGPAGNAVNLQLGWAMADNGATYFDDFLTPLTETAMPVPAETWHFVAVTIDGAGNGTVYQDGQVVITFATTRTIPSDARFSIGHEWDGGPSDFFAGYLDELTIHRAVRTEAQLVSEMWSGADNADPDLVARYTFETGPGDASGNGHDGTLQATAAIVATP